MSNVERDALLFEAGEYPDKGCTVTEADIDAVIANANSQNASIKLEHMDTALDGALGSVTRLWRSGKQLWGRLSLAEGLWSLVNSAKAYKLSVGLNLADKELQEVSIVRTPRVKTARVFSEGNLVCFNGFTVDAQFGLGGLSAREVQTKLYDMLNPDPYMGEYVWIEDLYEDSVILNQGGICYRRALNVVDGDITLGTPEEVVRDWRPVKTENQSRTSEDTTMSETYTKAEVEELVNKVKSETVAEFSGKLEELKAETAASNAKAEANALLAAGKIEASEVEHTASILMSDGADAFRKLLDARGTASTEAGSGGKQQVKWSKDAESIFAGLGLDAEEIEAATKDLATA